MLKGKSVGVEEAQGGGGESDGDGIVMMYSTQGHHGERERNALKAINFHLIILRFI